MGAFGLCWGPSWRPFGGLLGASWGLSGASWGPLAGLLGLLVASRGPLGGFLGPPRGPQEGPTGDQEAHEARKRLPRAPQEPPRGPQELPGGPQEPPKRPPRSPQEAPERPPRGPQTAPNRHRNGPQEAASELLPGGPRETYHDIRTNCPDASMRGPRRLQDSFKSAPEPPKTDPQRPWMAPLFGPPWGSSRGGLGIFWDCPLEFSWAPLGALLGSSYSALAGIVSARSIF